MIPSMWTGCGGRSFAAMRISLLPILALVALALAVPAANARIDDPPQSAAIHNLSSPDAQDANAAQHAQTLQDFARLRGGPDVHKQSPAGTASKPSVHWYYGNQGLDPKTTAALSQERYYSSYGRAQKPAADEDSPWTTIAVGVVLIVVVATAVGIGVRTRRRVRVAV